MSLYLSVYHVSLPDPKKGQQAFSEQLRGAQGRSHMMDLDDRVNRLEGDLTRFRRFTLLLSGFLAIVLLSAFRLK